MTIRRNMNDDMGHSPGLKVVVTDQDGDRYTLKNPALVTRELSELAASKGLFKFKITSLKPLNSGNSPDPFERKALTHFEQGNSVYTEYEQKGNELLYRYMAPLVTEKSCLRCHAAQGYREGDIRHTPLHFTGVHKRPESG